MPVYAISDLHVDYQANLDFVQSWSSEKYRNDCLIVAGDVTDNLKLLQQVLCSLKTKFAEVTFVPGNHELWIRPKEQNRDSISKFRRIISLCAKMGVHTTPFKFCSTSIDAVHQDVWLVPLHSWYSTPEDDLLDTLYMRHPAIKDNAETSNTMWMDNHMCKWPSLRGQTKSQTFSSLNEKYLDVHYDAPVITFSHMVPRKDLIKGDGDDKLKVNQERHRCGLEDAPAPATVGMPGFNFTRYAGSSTIDRQARKVQSHVHVYGHQHRNRDRVIDGVRYVSHCLGQVKEQKEGYVWGIQQWNGPKQIHPQLPQ